MYVVVDRFYIIIALFSALDQTHSALARSSKWVTVAFFKVRFEYPSSSLLLYVHGGEMAY